MSIVAAYVMPHEPLFIPSVGQGQEKRAQQTCAAMEFLAKDAAGHKPETIIIASPHAPSYAQGFYVSLGAGATGSMAAFGAPHEKLEVAYQRRLASRARQIANFTGAPCTMREARDTELDYASFVPLWFLNRALALSRQQLDNCALVRVGVSGLDARAHQALGVALAQAADESEEDCIFIASADFSHALSENSPYGFCEAGPAFDEQICHLLREGQLEDFLNVDLDLRANAQECGLGALQIMAGALEKSWPAFSGQLLSYEDTLGVGFACAKFTPAASRETCM